MLCLSTFYPQEFLIAECKVDTEHIQLEIFSIQAFSSCPICGKVSNSVHSYYSRKLIDLPIINSSVYINLLCRKFFCRNESCRRKIFTERFANFIKPYARQTDRLKEILVYLSFILSGEAGHRFSKKLRIALSPDKLINLAKAESFFQPDFIREIGIDDFAYKKGHTYGTLICNLKTHKPVALLEGRDTSLGEWLEKHPEVSLISRDRSGSYAKIIAEKVPWAVNVADRFHLLKNLLDATKSFIKCNVPETIIVETDEETSAKVITAIESNPLTQDKQKRFENQKRKKRIVRKVKKLRKEGFKISEIVSKTGLDPKTVRRYVRLDIKEAATYSVTQRKTTLDAYTNLIIEDILQGKNGMEIFHTLKELGFKGALRTVHRHIRKLKLTGCNYNKGDKPIVKSKKKYQRFKRADLIKRIAKYKEDLTPTDNECLQAFFDKSKLIKPLCLLIREFRVAMKNKNVKKLKLWIEEVKKLDIPEVSVFADGLKRDWEEVKNAFTLPYNNGLLEGQVNRLKMIKRQMYGRCGFDLLRQKVLFRA